ncbi:MAG: response regulator [Candidatus Omnitrophica bacterium]|nr:response regulator [Candidatus Omnitrophota bacterium]
MNEHKSAKKHKILVVDDQVGIVSFLYDFFTIKEYDVLQATSGKKAIKLVAEEKPELVLLDVRLGWGKDGIEVLKEIKEIAPDIRVIMMTSVADEDVIEEAFSLGADDYVIKPFSLKYLEKVVMLKVLNLEIERLGESPSEQE